MTRVIVHAGFHKTGTTSLQDFLKDNSDALPPWLTYYGKAEFVGVDAAARTFGQRPFWWRRLWFRRSFRRFLERIPRDDTIVLSCETFSGAMPGHRRTGGRMVEKYTETAIPLAQEILHCLRDHFGHGTSVEFLYTLRDRDSWLASIHGHLLRSIRLDEDLDAFRAGFRQLPDLRADVSRIATALSPIPVHISWLEDYADQPEGPAGAILDLTEFPDALRDSLRPALLCNPGQSQELRHKFLELNRTDGKRADLKAEKEALLSAAVAAPPEKP